MQNQPCALNKLAKTANYSTPQQHFYNKQTLLSITKKKTSKNLQTRTLKTMPVEPLTGGWLTRAYRI